MNSMCSLGHGPTWSYLEIGTGVGSLMIRAQYLVRIFTIAACLPMNLGKKRKMNDKYENFSREDLLSRIRDLEDDVLFLKNLKSNSNDTVQNFESSESNSNETDGLNSKNSHTKRKIDFSKYQRRHIALKMMYLGWNYNGFAITDNTVSTIEDYLFKALLKGRLIEDRATSHYHKCGRTDQGVSSFSQVISLTVRSRLNNSNDDAEELPYCKILNSLLPSDIRVMAWSPVDENFSARYGCKKRTYKYWFPRGDLNIDKMRQAVQKVIGVHDFRNLCKMDVAGGITNFVREIFDAQISVFCENNVLEDRVYDMFVLTIVGKGFLWHQIRCIVSILFLIGSEKEEVDIVDKLLDVETYPRKPQYGLSSGLPLNLYSCEFDGVDWKVDEETANKLMKKLQSYWTFGTIKKCMLDSMLKDYSRQLPEVPTNLTSALLEDGHLRKYKPLLSRPVAPSLENRITHYIRRGKLKPDRALDAGSAE